METVWMDEGFFIGGKWIITDFSRNLVSWYFRFSFLFKFSFFSLSLSLFKIKIYLFIMTIIVVAGNWTQDLWKRSLKLEAISLAQSLVILKVFPFSCFRMRVFLLEGNITTLRKHCYVFTPVTGKPCLHWHLYLSIR